MKQDRIASRLAAIVVVAALYLAAAKLGLRLAFLNPSASAVWPPTGIALAALLLLGYRMWPAILIGAFLANVTNAVSFPTSIGIAAGNTLEGLVAAWLVNRFASGRKAFSRPPDVFKFALYAGAVSPVVGATIGVTSLTLGGFARWADFVPVWFTWWLGDAMGALVIAPPLILWTLPPGLRLRGRRLLEAMLLFSILILVALAVFSSVLYLGAKNYPLEFLLIPLLVWCAFRFRPRGTATFALVASAIALWGTLNGFGPFAVGSPNESLLLLQSFTGIIAMTGLGITAVVSEQRAADRELRAARDELETRVEERTESLTGAVQALRDEVAERQRTEETLRRQTELNESIVRTQSELGEGVAIVDGERLTFVNDALCEMYGYEKSELLAMPSTYNLLAREERAPLIEKHDRRLRGEERFDSGEATVIRKDGRKVAVEYAIKILDAHDPVRVFSIIRDVTERKKAAEALAASEQRFKGLLESAPDAMVIVDDEGKIRIVNSQTEKMFGYGREEMYGKGIEMLIPERFHGGHILDRAGYFQAPLTRSMGAGVELAGVRKEGTEFPVDISLSPLTTEEGTLVTAAVRDITDRKRAEELLKSRQLELQASNNLLRALTARLEVVREEERARIARELHDELGQALTALRFDLSSLTSHLPNGNDEMYAHVRAMSDQIDATVKTVRRIGTELRPGMLDDLGLAAAIEWQAQEFAARTGIECQVTLPDHEIRPDRERATAIFRVFQETLTNVARHAKATSVMVLLESVGEGLRLTVRDNGSGFDREQVSATRSLGLAGMRERTEIFDGRFQIESATGQGTTVTMIVPL